MLEYIRNELLGMTDKGEYAAFTSSLIPGCDNIIGIRQPVLKQYAKQLIKENKDFRKLLSEPDIYQEETLLRSYIIGMGTAKEKDFKKAFKRLQHIRSSCEQLGCKRQLLCRIQGYGYVSGRVFAIHKGMYRII